MDKQTEDAVTKVRAKALAFTQRAKAAVAAAPAPIAGKRIDTSTRGKKVTSAPILLDPVSISVIEQASAPSLATLAPFEATPGIAVISETPVSIPVIIEKLETVLLSGGEIASPTPGE